MNRRRQKILPRAAALLPALLLFMFPLSSRSEGQARTALDLGSSGTLEEAKARLQEGINTWNAATLESARNAFLGLLLKDPRPSAHLLYYVALSDYRLASHHLSAGHNEESDRYISEGQQYASKALEADASSGEACALHAFLLSLEIALHPERAMTLGLQSIRGFARALEIEPENPRVNLLKGIYQLYVPEAYGGGAESALEFLNRSAALFDKERVPDPLLPSWGKEEAYTYLGRAFRMTKDFARARSSLTKALAVNPDFGLAKSELQALDKDEKGG